MRAANAKARPRLPRRVDVPEPAPTGVVLTEEQLGLMDSFTLIWRRWMDARKVVQGLQREWAIASEVEFEAERVLDEALAACEAAGVDWVRDRIPLPAFPPDLTPAAMLGGGGEGGTPPLAPIAAPTSTGDCLPSGDGGPPHSSSPSPPSDPPTFTGRRPANSPGGPVSDQPEATGGSES